MLRSALMITVSLRFANRRLHPPSRQDPEHKGEAHADP